MIFGSIQKRRYSNKRQTQQSDYKQMLLLIRLACTFKTMNDIFTPISYIVVRSH